MISLPLYCTPLYQGGCPHYFLCGCVSLPYISNIKKKYFSVCASNYCAMSLIKNFVLVFTVFASLIYLVFKRGKSRRNFASIFQPLVDIGYPGSILGQGTRILLQATPHRLSPQDQKQNEDNVVVWVGQCLDIFRLKLNFEELERTFLQISDNLYSLSYEFFTQKEKDHLFFFTNPQTSLFILKGLQVL